MRSADPYPCIHKPPVLRHWRDIYKAREDTRSYRVIQLQNFMKILLISDRDTEKSAAAVDVNVGSLSDPVEVPGLAHFCEHMLFLGTEKYPDSNDFMKYVAQRGGRNNATTISDHTTYYFDIAPDFLRGALDRFAQFFISPLFGEDGTAREIKAIQSEFEKNYGNDTWRFDQLDRHTAKPGHPYAKFSHGNMTSLVKVPRERGIDVREELKKFHAKWYSSNIMTAAVLGKEDLDELEKMVVELFSGIANKNALHLEWREHPFGPEQCKVAVFGVPLESKRTLSISFPSPDHDKHYRTKPFHYVSSLLGHEGPGSLFSALKKRGWCDRLRSGARIGGKGFGVFLVNMDLTEEGMEHVHEIVRLLFQYVHMLQSKGPQKWFFDEYRKLLDANFRFKEKENPSSYVTALANNLHVYPAEQVLQGPYLLDRWDPEIIKEFTAMIAPSRIRLAVAGRNFECVAYQVEPWYGTKYILEHVPDYVVRDWENCGVCPELELPQPNDFIPASYRIVPREEEEEEEEESHPHPVVLKETPLARVWYKQDEEFLLPHANLYFEFYTPLAYIDPSNFNLAAVYVLLVEDALIESTYAAELAGTSWNIKNTEYGITLTIGGYNDKQSILFDRILETMMNLQVDPERFERLKNRYVRMLANFDAQQPCEQTTYYLTVLVCDYSWKMDELQKATDILTIKRVEEFVPQLFSKLFVECLVHGNVTKEWALELVSIVEKRLRKFQSVRPLLPLQLLRRREIQLSDGANFSYEIRNAYQKFSCTELYYQCDVQSTKDNMLMELLVHLIVGPAFNTLRTQEQLGYMVYTGIRRSNCVHGLRLILQSHKHPLYLEQRIEAFLIRMRQILVDMKESAYKTHKNALADLLLQKPKTLTALTTRYWKEINQQQYHFNRAEEEVAYLRTIEKNSLLEFFDTYIKYGAPKRRKLSVHVLSQADGGAGKLPAPDEETLNSSPRGSNKPPPFVQPEPIRDVTRFKSAHGFFPFAEPHADIDAFRIPAANLH